MIVVSSLKLVSVEAALVPLHLLLRELKFKESGAAQTIATLSRRGLHRRCNSSARRTHARPGAFARARESGVLTPKLRR